MIMAIKMGLNNSISMILKEMVVNALRNMWSLDKERSRNQVQGHLFKAMLNVFIKGHNKRDFLCDYNDQVYYILHSKYTIY